VQGGPGADQAGSLEVAQVVAHAPLHFLFARPVRFRALADDTTVVSQNAYSVEKDTPRKQAQKQKRRH
jgi:hypothetical protein